MASEPKIIEVEPGSEVDRLLDEAAERPLRLARGGEEFRLHLVNAGRAASPDAGTMRALEQSGEDRIARRLSQPPSAEVVARSVEGIRRAAGSWKDIDAEAFKAYIHERRRTSSRPPVRW